VVLDRVDRTPTKEPTMHPFLTYAVVQSRIVDLNRLASSGNQARPGRRRRRRGR
jgi:hypothetical protein